MPDGSVSKPAGRALRLAAAVAVLFGAAIGLWLHRRWAASLALALAVLTAAVFAAFAWHVAAGGAFEVRTVAAMTLRTLVWAGIAALAWFSLRRPERA